MTRYPKSGKGSKWTVKELDAIPSDWKGDTINDGFGLSGEVRLSSKNEVSIRFKYAYRWETKLTWYQCGTYPTCDMSEIRKHRDDARQLIKNGIDPRSYKKAEKIEAQLAVNATIKADEAKRTDMLSFQDLYDLWIKDGVNRADGNKYITLTFNKNVLPFLGEIEIRHLSENDLRGIYRKIIAEGKVATAVELSKDIKQMLNWAEKRKPWRNLLVEGNPAELVEINKLLPVDYNKERTRVLSLDDIMRLKSIFDNIAEEYQTATKKYGVERPIKQEVQIAVWLCLSTLCRIGELLMTEWQHVDFEKKVWFIPKENTKGQRGKKQDQIVYLSDFALSQFNELKKLTGDSVWVFPARYKDGHVCVKSASKQIGDRQMKFKHRSKKFKYRVENDSLVLGNEEWTPHDLRRTGATMMQKLNVPRDIINLCQNHVIGSKIDRVYLLHDYADEKKEAWRKLGNWVNEIFTGQYNKYS